MTNKFVKRKIRHRRVRNKIRGTLQIPRLSVFRSNKHIFAQIIDDSKSKTLASTSDLKMKGKWAKGENNNLEKAFEVGLNLAKVTQKKNIKKATHPIKNRAK